jgi:hypothetical protein
VASFTLNGLPEFPNGTSVKAYPRANWNGPVVTTAAPVGSETETQTVSGGTASFTALASDTRYVAYAQVNGAHRYKRFSTLVSPTEGSGIAVTAWQGEWSNATVYTTGQIVGAGGNSYVALVGNSGVDPEADDGSTWALFASAGSPGAPGAAGVTLSEDKGSVGGSVTWGRGEQH